jgi:hypothetical protein
MLGKLMENENYRIIRVVNKPYVIWGNELQKDNEEFLNEFNPYYFIDVANAVVRLINDKAVKVVSRENLKMSIRQTYYTSLECFFAFIGATLQAPNCVFAWLAKYKNSDLYDMIRKINQAEFSKVRFKTDDYSWNGLCKFIIPQINGVNGIADDFDKNIEFIKILANDFVDEKNEREYNCIKHGLRGKQNSIRTLSINNCKYEFDCSGTEYTEVITVNDDKKYKYNLSHRKVIIHYDVNTMISRIALMCNLLNNIKVFLYRFYPEKPQSALFASNDQLLYERAMNTTNVGLQNIVIDKGFNPCEQDILFTNEDLERLLNNAIA